MAVESVETPLELPNTFHLKVRQFMLSKQFIIQYYSGALKRDNKQKTTDNLLNLGAFILRSNVVWK